jgi:hypothetical protein
VQWDAALTQPVLIAVDELPQGTVGQPLYSGWLHKSVSGSGSGVMYRMSWASS